MANQAHLDLFKQGHPTWNAWRAVHPHIQPDLTDADLSGADLANANLNCADLSNADLRGAQLERVIADGASFRAADLRGIPWAVIQALQSQPGTDFTDAQWDQPEEAAR